MTPRALFLAALCSSSLVAEGQVDTFQAAPWLNREFRYWRGDPMLHGPNGECIAGYTDEQRRASFFRDGRYQEIIFEDRGFVHVRILEPGDCAPLQGDMVAVVSGT